MTRTSRDSSGTGHGNVTQVEFLNLKKDGQFPDESVRIKDSQIHYVTSRRTHNSRFKGDIVRGTISPLNGKIRQYSTILSYFVSGRLV